MVKYTRRKDVDHLITTLHQHYDMPVDEEGKKYVKINLDWDYENGFVHLSMQPYLAKALMEFEQDKPIKPQDSPYPHVVPKYGAKVQMAEYDNSPPVGHETQKKIQKFNGKFLWYAHGVDSTILTALSALALQQTNPMQTR